MGERQGASKSVFFFPCLGRAPLKKRSGTQQLISERANQLGRGSLTAINVSLLIRCHSEMPVKLCFLSREEKKAQKAVFFKSQSWRVAWAPVCVFSRETEDRADGVISASSHQLVQDWASLSLWRQAQGLHKVHWNLTDRLYATFRSKGTQVFSSVHLIMKFRMHNIWQPSGLENGWMDISVSYR